MLLSIPDFLLSLKKSTRRNKKLQLYRQKERREADLESLLMKRQNLKERSYLMGNKKLVQI
jgi:hypothetical protein